MGKGRRYKPKKNFAEKRREKQKVIYFFCIAGCIFRLWIPPYGFVNLQLILNDHDDH